MAKENVCYCRDCGKFVPFQPAKPHLRHRERVGEYNAELQECLTCGGVDVAVGTEDGLREFFELGKEVRSPLL